MLVFLAAAWTDICDLKHTVGSRDAWKQPRLILIRISQTGLLPYLLSSNSYLSVVDQAHSCLASDTLIEAFGPPSKELSAAMGIPHPRQCDFCDQGNRKKAGTSGGVKFPMLISVKYAM